MIISLWSGPRNCSTALMYSLAQRTDMAVRDEPLFGHFLAHTGVERPSREATLAAWPTTPEAALARCKPDANGPPHLFLKHMGNHIEGLTREAFADHQHVILTRHPDAVLKSYAAHVKEPTMLDLCYGHQHAWLDHCKQSAWPLHVVDSDALLERPRQVLEGLCDQLGLPWDEAMMQWPAGPRPEDGPWARHWYGRVHQSTGWESRPPASYPVSTNMRALRDDALSLYKSMVGHPSE
jgi:hypothetical protein